jgi:hypothetical protein
VAWRVVGGGCTLLEAAADMREINSRSSHFQRETFRDGYPADTDDERHCREVINWVGNVLPDGPHADTLIGRLEAELYRHRECGTLILPGQRP